MNYYNEIKNKLIDNEIYARVKDYSKERNKVITYFEIGKLLNEAGSKYGENIINKYSEKLMIEVGKKYNRRTLFRMRQFYNVFSNKKVSQMATQLSWSHYTELLVLKSVEKITYYVNRCFERNLSRNDLRKAIKSKEYERLDRSAKLKLINEEKLEIKDLIPNPIMIDNKNNYEIVSEKILQKIILENISSFLRELGTGYTYIDNEYKIKLGDTYNYIDLLLFNYKYNCFVVVELKVTELKKEHIGQIEFYMQYINNNLRNITHDKTIGLIICKKNNKYVIEYASDKRIIEREYLLM